MHVALSLDASSLRAPSGIYSFRPNITVARVSPSFTALRVLMRPSYSFIMVSGMVLAASAISLVLFTRCVLTFDLLHHLLSNHRKHLPGIDRSYLFAAALLR